MAKIDDILDYLSDEKPDIASEAPETVKKERPSSKEVKSWVADNVTFLIIAIVAIIILFGGYRMYRNAQSARIAEQQQLAESKNAIEKNDILTKEQEKEAEFLLTKQEYRDNIEYLVSKDIGLVEDSQKGLTGSLNFPSGKEIVLSYTRKDGVLHTINSKQEAVSYSNKWVRAFIAKLKAQDNLEKGVDSKE